MSGGKGERWRVGRGVKRKGGEGRERLEGAREGARDGQGGDGPGVDVARHEAAGAQRVGAGAGEEEPLRAGRRSPWITSPFDDGRAEGTRWFREAAAGSVLRTEGLEHAEEGRTVSSLPTVTQAGVPPRASELRALAMEPAARRSKRSTDAPAARGRP